MKTNNAKITQSVVRTKVAKLTPLEMEKSRHGVLGRFPTPMDDEAFSARKESSVSSPHEA